MSQPEENKDLIRRFLLGDLTEQEREHVEQRLLSDDDLYQQLLMAEDELEDEFVCDALPEQERAKFSRHFLRVPELRQDVRFAAALRKHVLEAASPATIAASTAATRASLLDWLRNFFMQPALGVSLAAMLLAAVLLAAWLIAQNSQLRKQVEQLQARQTPMPTSQQDLQEQLAWERLRNEQLSAELLREQERRTEEARKIQEAKEQPRPTPARKPAPPGTAAVVALALTPGLIRESGAWQKLSVPPEAREVVFRLDLPEGGHRSYQAVLKTVGGKELLSRRGLRANSGGKFVSVSIPAKLFGPNDYQILLSGVTPSGEPEDVGSYYFRVLK